MALMSGQSTCNSCCRDARNGSSGDEGGSPPGASTTPTAASGGRSLDALQTSSSSTASQAAAAAPGGPEASLPTATAFLLQALRTSSHSPPPPPGRGGSGHLNRSAAAADDRQGPSPLPSATAYFLGALHQTEEESADPLQGSEFSCHGRRASNTSSTSHGSRRGKLDNVAVEALDQRSDMENSVESGPRERTSASSGTSAKHSTPTQWAKEERHMECAPGMRKSPMGNILECPGDHLQPESSLLDPRHSSMSAHSAHSTRSVQSGTSGTETFSPHRSRKNSKDYSRRPLDVGSFNPISLELEATLPSSPGGIPSNWEELENEKLALRHRQEQIELRQQALLRAATLEQEKAKLKQRQREIELEQQALSRHVTDLASGTAR